MSQFAMKLSSGVLNEMKRRILNSNIQKEKLSLDEASVRMRQFFHREIERYTKRQQRVKEKQETVMLTEKQLRAYQQAMTDILKCNLSLAKKCQKNNVVIERVNIVGSAFSYR
jgi:hypothetical protein